MLIVRSLRLKTLLILTLVTLIPLNINAKALIMYTSDAPPHMIAATNSGIDIDIVRSVLNSLGHQVDVKFSPLKRAMEQVKMHKADVFLPTFYQQDSDNIYISNPYMQYRPMIFTLKESAIKIESYADLHDVSVVSFQGASGYFGEALSTVIEQQTYTELHDMSTLPTLLLMKRFDVVILDYYIFYYFLKMYQENYSPEANLDYALIDDYASLVQRHDIIAPANVHVGFNNADLRDKFNQQLKLAVKDELHNQIIEKYIGTISSRILVFKRSDKAHS